MDTERRTLRGVVAHSYVKLATGPLELANHCQQSAGVTPPHYILHNRTDSAAGHTLTPLHSRSHQLPLCSHETHSDWLRATESQKLKNKLEKISPSTFAF